uniref:PiggyBac transposable element-derived protein domain-containing protein n=1 Tax=Trichogramma kaykai TaxID=54128 RepID=A0ABD2W3J1_9HYME
MKPNPRKRSQIESDVSEDEKLLPPKSKTSKNSDLSKKLEFGLKYKRLKVEKTKTSNHRSTNFAKLLDDFDEDETQSKEKGQERERASAPKPELEIHKSSDQNSDEISDEKELVITAKKSKCIDEIPNETPKTIKPNPRKRSRIESDISEDEEPLPSIPADSENSVSKKKLKPGPRNEKFYVKKGQEKESANMPEQGLEINGSSDKNNDENNDNIEEKGEKTERGTADKDKKQVKTQARSKFNSKDKNELAAGAGGSGSGSNDTVASYSDADSKDEFEENVVGGVAEEFVQRRRREDRRRQEHERQEQERIRGQVVERARRIGENNAGQNMGDNHNANHALDERNDADPLVRCHQPGNGRVQMVSLFNVWIDKAKLTNFQRWWASPKDLTWHLIKELVGPGNLYGMCARGRSKSTTGIPKDILTGVEFYVNRKCSPGLKPAEFINVINLMIGGIRHPRQ